MPSFETFLKLVQIDLMRVRAIVEQTNSPELLYFIDMAIQEAKSKVGSPPNGDGKDSTEVGSNLEGPPTG